MPIRYTTKGWYWGSHGPFGTREKAVQVAEAAYSNGYSGESSTDKSAQKRGEYKLNIKLRKS